MALLLGGKSVLACMCGDTPSVSEARDKAKAVFLGKAISSKYQKGTVFLNGQELGEQLTVSFRVERWWKGGDAKEVILFEPEYLRSNYALNVSNCGGAEYKIGKLYLVYAFEDTDNKSKLTSAYCSRVAEATKAKEDLIKLGKGRKPNPSKENR